MTDRASVTLKLATSIDSRIALSDGTSQWITCAESRKRAHKMRAEHDAVLVGLGTVLADDPLLTARLDGYQPAQPLRIVADSRARTPIDGQLVRSISPDRPVCVAMGVNGVDELEAHRRADALSKAGVHVRKVVRAAWGGLDPEGLVAAIDGLLGADLKTEPRGSKGRTVLLEGGGRLAASFVRAGLVDRIAWFRAPILIGSDGAPALGDLGLTTLSAAARFTLTATEQIGDDVLDTYVRGQED